jgi:hypothetical protein
MVSLNDAGERPQAGRGRRTGPRAAALLYGQACDCVGRRDKKRCDDDLGRPGSVLLGWIREQKLPACMGVAAQSTHCVDAWAACAQKSFRECPDGIHPFVRFSP